MFDRLTERLFAAMTKGYFKNTRNGSSDTPNLSVKKIPSQPLLIKTHLQLTRQPIKKFFFFKTSLPVSETIIDSFLRNYPTHLNHISSGPVLIILFNDFLII